MRPPHEEPPVNPLPPLAVAIAGAVFVIEVIFLAGARGLVGGPGAVSWRRDSLLEYGFSDVAFDRMLQLGVWDWDAVMRMFTYSFVHYGMAQVLFLCVLVLALGKWVGEQLPQWTIVVVFFVGAVTGALAYGLVLDTPMVLVGGFPGAYGLIGAFTFLLWVRLADSGGPQARAFILIGALVAIQLVFGLVGGALTGGGAMSRDWVANLGGFAAGFAVTLLLSPGGWARTAARIRRR
ncbi:MAG: rhomboid family intramembrane serine protease [Rhodobacteraceae bacterium]|nr:rhomboid family intramembrane serine protease [Paracoccaceae bacterium]